ncbi:MAG: DUF2478 domain-containing protein [Pseudomonadota bacterium]
MGDVLMAQVADRLRASGVAVAGAIQANVERDPTRKCDMELHVLTGTSVVKISQDLGRHAVGCRLDAGGLEHAVGLVATSLLAVPPLLIINKFGKQEADGHGFRPIIGQAVAAGIPVLTSVGSANLEGFLSFADGMAEPLPPDEDVILAWCRDQIAQTDAAVTG